MKRLDFEFIYIGGFKTSSLGLVSSIKEFLHLFKQGKKIWIVARNVSFEFLVTLVEKYRYEEVTVVFSLTEELLSNWKKEVESQEYEKLRSKLFKSVSEKKIIIYALEESFHLRHFIMIEKKDGSYFFTNSHLAMGELKFDTAFLFWSEKNTPLYFRFKNDLMSAILNAEQILPPRL